MNYSNYQEALEALYHQAPSFQNEGRKAYHPGLENMQAFDDMLNHPHKRYPIIHIAGTNGKGSVAHILSSIASSFGMKVGLYTSPHLSDFRERIKIVDQKMPQDENSDGKYSKIIPQKDILDFLNKSLDFINKHNPSFFEITTAMAFDYFASQHVDVAVIEAGLGGRLDSTNIVSPRLSIITSIGYDHKDMLGDTLEKIATEKAGIIKNQTSVVIGDMTDSVVKIFKDTAQTKDSELIQAGTYTHIDFSKMHRIMDLKGLYQSSNLHIALSALETLQAYGIYSHCIFGIPQMDAVVHTAEYTGFHGRWETLSTHPTIICDIAHNEHSLRPVTEQLMKTFEEGKYSKLKIIFGISGDKDINEIKRIIPTSTQAEYYFTNATGSRAMPADSLRKIMEDYWEMLGVKKAIPSKSIGNIAQAMDMAMQGSTSDLIFIGGSCFVVAEALEKIRSANRVK